MRSFLLIFCLTFAFLIGLNVITTMNFSEQLVVNSKKNEASLINDIIENFERNVSSIHNLISDSYVNNYIRRSEKLTEQETVLLSARLNHKETSCNYVIKDMDIPFHVVILSENGLMHISRDYASSHETEEIKNSEWLNEIKKSELYIGHAYNYNDYNAGTEDELMYISYKNSFKIENGKKNFIATMAVCIDAEWIASLYKESIDNNTCVYIFDEDNNLFSSNAVAINKVPNSAIIEFLHNDADSEDGSNGLMVKWHSEDSKFTIVETIPRSIIYEQFVSSFILNALAAVIAFAVGFVLIYWLSKSLVNPLSVFCRKLEKSDYNKIIKVPDGIRYTEIYQLYTSYSFLYSRNLYLIQKQFDNEKKIKEEELKFLKAQINPHFLYNTLFSIKCTAKLGKVNDACKMLDLLEDMLRKNLHSADEVQPICDELIAVKDYISLVAYGMDYELHFSYEVEEHLQYKNIMKFLLQPIIENAIFHGIKPLYKDGGYIWIKVCEENGKIVVSVRDNGIGMSDDEVREIEKSSEKESKYYGHIGLANIRTRIKENYGEGYEMLIESKERVGTTVILILPVL